MRTFMFSMFLVLSFGVGSASADNTLVVGAWKGTTSSFPVSAERAKDFKLKVKAGKAEVKDTTEMRVSPDAAGKVKGEWCSLDGNHARGGDLEGVLTPDGADLKIDYFGGDEEVLKTLSEAEMAEELHYHCTMVVTGTGKTAELHCGRAVLKLRRVKAACRDL